MSSPARSAFTSPVVWAAVLLAVWAVPWMVGGGSVVVDGHRYFFLADDPTISMRYGRSLAEGHGLVWNPGERVEGYSNFVWTLYFAVLHLLPIPTPLMALAVMITNVGIAIAGLVLLHALVRKLSPEPALAAAAVLAYALNGDLFEWMIRGFETSLMATVLLGCFLRLVTDGERGRPRLLTYLLIGSLTLIRTDGLILAGPLLLLGVVTSRQRLRAFLYAATAMIMPVAHLAFRWSYYHDLLPNTAYLKIFGFTGRLKSGLRWTFKFYASYPIAALFVVAALARARRDWPLAAGAALCLLFSAYTIYVGGDSFDGFRFLAPLIPLFLLVTLVTAWRVVDDRVEARVAAAADRVLRARWIEIAVAIAGVAVFAACAAIWPEKGQFRFLRQSVIHVSGALALGIAVFALARRARRAAPARLAVLVVLICEMPLVLWSHRRPAPWGPAYPANVRMGLFLKEHTPPDAVIGDGWAGLPPYFSGRRGVDFLGKCERHVGHMPAASQGSVPGHNKFDFDYSLGTLRPDYVAAFFQLPVDEAEMRADATGDYAFMGALICASACRAPSGRRSGSSSSTSSDGPRRGACRGSGSA